MGQFGILSDLSYRGYRIRVHTSINHSRSIKAKKYVLKCNGG